MMLVDTSVWSLALRRDHPAKNRFVKKFGQALFDGEVVLTGIILQELLQGLVDGAAKERLIETLSTLPLLVPSRSDHTIAAELLTTCRRHAVQLGTVDALIAALCVRRNLTLLSTDKDFRHAAKFIELAIWPNEAV